MNIGDEVSVELGGIKVTGKIQSMNKDCMFIAVPDKSHNQEKLIKVLVTNRSNEPNTYRIVQVDEDGRERFME